MEQGNNQSPSHSDSPSGQGLSDNPYAAEKRSPSDDTEIRVSKEGSGSNDLSASLTKDQPESQYGSKAPADQQCEQQPAKKDPSPRSKPIFVVSVIVLGLAFGWLLHKTGVSRRDVIRGQMDFTIWTMLVVFLVASATSVIVLTVVGTCFPGRLKKSSEKHLTSPTMGIPAVLCGTFLVGVGMTLSGACPGTVYAQLGSGNAAALFIVGGGLLGATVHAMLYPSMLKFIKYGVPLNRTIYHALGARPWITAILIAAAMATASVLVYVYLPVVPPLHDPTDTGVFGEFWNPILGGSLIGLIQFPLVSLLNKALGASTSFSVVASNTILACYSKSSYANKLKGWNVYGFWQVLFVGSVILGAVLAAWESDNWYTSDPSEAKATTYILNTVGGFIMIFGARLASGCTSGHGITGVGFQSIASFLGVMSMFAGGIIMGLIIL